jgi:hypothetical protein
VRTIERLEEDPGPILARPTRERLVADGFERISKPSANGSGH